MVDLTLPPLPVPPPNVAEDLEQTVQPPERTVPDLGSEFLPISAHGVRDPALLPITDSDLVPGGPLMPYFEPKAEKALPTLGSPPNELSAAGIVPSAAAGVTLATASLPRPVGTAAKDVAGATVNSATPPLLKPAKNSSATKPLPIEAGPAKEGINDLSAEGLSIAALPRLGGTDAAKQHVAMSITETEAKPKSKTLDATALPRNSDARTTRAIQSSQAPDLSSGDPQTDSRSSSQPGAADPAMPLNANVSISSSDAEPPQNVARAEQVTRLLNTVTEAIESLRSDGRTNVEMQIKLRDGEQITVKLQMHAGEVRAIFKTDSSELRGAIARGWSSFSSSSAERGVRVTTPVFESPSGQPGFNNQRQDRREQAEGTASDQSLTPSVFKKHHKPALSPLTPAPTASPLHQDSTSAAGLAAWA